MIDQALMQNIVARANLAPSVHNVQPARWRLVDGIIDVAADLCVHLAAGDAQGQDAGLSCGAAVEATVLALGDHGLGAQVDDLWLQEDQTTWPGHRMAARLTVKTGQADPLSPALEARFTWRGGFETGAVPAWDTADAILVTDAADRQWLAQKNDQASLDIMTQSPFRKELLHWMRLSKGHPRHDFDGLNRVALNMSKTEARLARWALGPLWPILHLLGASKGITAEADKTLTAPIIALFHARDGESPVTTGRRYLRLCLEATTQGLAMWPMAALSDHPATHADICARFDIAAPRKLVQALRFGRPRGSKPDRARRPLKEVLS